MFVDVLFLVLLFFSYSVGIVLLLCYFYNKNRKDPRPKKNYGVSFLIPMWNEEKTIIDTLNSVIDMCKNYKGQCEILVIDNNSKDNGPKLVKELAKKSKYVKLIFEKDKQGKSFAVNKGIKLAKYELIVTIDADSFPDKDALNYVVGYFDDPKVGAVSTKLRVKNPKKIIEKMQNIEYFYSNFYMLGLDYLDSIYVTRGPLSAFRKSVLLKIGGFIDPKITPTEDMEVTFRIRKLGYKIAMSKDAIIDTKVMQSFKALYVQRMRWNTGTIKTFFLHRDVFLNPKYSFFGWWISPIVALSFILMLFGAYAAIRALIQNYHSIYAFFWNLFQGIPIDFTFARLVYNQPLFFVPYYALFIFITIFLLVVVYYYAFKESKTKVFGNIIAFFAYAIFYYFFLLFFNIAAILKLIFNKTVPWR